MSRERRLVEAFVQLADSLVEDYDPVDVVQQLLDRAVDLLPVDTAAVLLAREDGELKVLASTSEATRWLELLQIQAQDGPCVQSYRDSERVVVEDLEAARDRWPAFAKQALLDGFQSVYALPLRLRADRVGALNLFSTGAEHMTEDDLLVGQALADIASIAILQARMLADHKAVNGQLQSALESRIVIEQAKGMLAAHGDLDPDAAFEILRAHARRSRIRLPELARAVVDRTVGPAEILAARPR
ncbi:GAF domain-containing protein [Nocardia tenerifensis]|uniref:GAF domain-containing protein n=1 Tax=Nocardia tenerifensis TaxID=228006 RepID=A0A318K5B8_9NOCA|nr:GAF and ANTAR domain-containing protein [Nocardia tenerifensis]PXX58163.1 GAF domain-containing protein [Nocardia tenerifensis]